MAAIVFVQRCLIGAVFMLMLGGFSAIGIAIGISVVSIQYAVWG